VRWALLLLVVVNGVLTLRALWGETWVANGTYFEMARHLRASPDACAVVSVRKPIATLLPGRRRDALPEPAFAFFPSERRAPSYPQITERPLIWVEHRPACRPEQPVLVHLHRPDARWVSEARCELQPSGVLSWAPRAKWDEVIAKGWAAGSWYRCPSSVLTRFTRVETRPVLARSLGKLDPLPRWRISGEELVAAGQKSVEGDVLEGTLGDW
jgi:hypothetical protein